MSLTKDIEAPPHRPMGAQSCSAHTRTITVPSHPPKSHPGANRGTHSGELHAHAHQLYGPFRRPAWNPGGLALYAGLDDWPVKQRSLARYLFLHPASRDLFTDWDRQITGCVARLRAIAGTAPDAPDLTNLVGELLLKSPDFAGLWERYEVTGRKPAHKTFHHPQVGTVTLTSQSLHLEGTPGERIGVYTAEPGSLDHDALFLLDMTGPRPAPSLSEVDPCRDDRPCQPVRIRGLTYESQLAIGGLATAADGAQASTWRTTTPTPCVSRCRDPHQARGKWYPTNFMRRWAQ